MYILGKILKNTVRVLETFVLFNLIHMEFHIHGSKQYIPEFYIEQHPFLIFF